MNKTQTFLSLRIQGMEVEEIAKTHGVQPNYVRFLIRQVAPGERARQRAYRLSPKGQAAEKRHRRSERGRAARNRRNARYNRRDGIPFKRKLWERFRITPAIWEQMLVEQAGRCDVCRQPMQKPNVDHRHRDGLVRALLCGPCNWLIGVAEREPKLAEAAAAYILRYE